MGNAARKQSTEETPAFTCPVCGGHELNLIRTAQLWVQPVEIVGDELKYGPMDAVDDPDSYDSYWRFECRNGDYVITNADGDEIGDTDELIEWCKNPVIDED
jgi:hypothetical protein